MKCVLTRYQQVAVFFRSRAEVEEKYARSVAELCRTTGDVYSRADCKAGCVVACSYLHPILTRSWQDIRRGISFLFEAAGSAGAK